MAAFYLILQSDAEGTSLQKAMLISREMYKMSRPVADINDGTLYLFEFIEHEDKTKTALFIDDDHDLPIAINANQTMLMAIFGKVATAAEIDTLKNKIDKAKGKKVKVRELLPFKLTKLTKEQIKAAGFMPGDEQPPI